jgi:hypothetical protein
MQKSSKEDEKNNCSENLGNKKARHAWRKRASTIFLCYFFKQELGKKILSFIP